MAKVGADGSAQVGRNLRISPGDLTCKCSPSGEADPGNRRLRGLLLERAGA